MAETTVRTINVYFVGETAEEAAAALPFDSEDSAQSYVDDENGGHIWWAALPIDPAALQRA